MIKLNDEFECEKDHYGWKLHQWKPSKKKDGTPSRKCHTTYHADLHQVGQAVINKAAQDCPNMEALTELLTQAEQRIAALLIAHG